MICFHCHLPLPLDKSFPVMVEGRQQDTCCPGCQAAATFVNEHQLSAYYRFRTEPNLKVEVDNRLQDFDKPYLAGGIQEAQILVDGIQCAACCWLIEKVLKLSEHVNTAQVGLEAQRILLRWNADQVMLSELLSKIVYLGYRVSIYQPEKQIEQLERARQGALLRFGWSALGMMQVMMFALAVYIGEFQDISNQFAYFMGLASLALTVPILYFGGQPFFIGAKRSLSAGQVSMDVPVSVALIAAFGVSLYHLAIGSTVVYFDTICMFLFFLSFNRFYEISAKLKAIYPIAHIKKSLIRDITLASGMTVSLNDVKVGDQFIITAGHLVPIDSRILKGESAISTAFLTGEVVPQLKGPGDILLAGSMNHDQPLLVEVKNEAAHSTLQGILNLIDAAEETKPKMVLWGNQIAQHFLICILLLAIIAGSYWGQFEIFLAILVVSCPCALSLALPLAMTVSKNALFKKGLILKQVDSLDRMLKIKTIMFDKTGTLTEGQFSVKAFDCASTVHEFVRSIVKSLEQYSEHPVGQALYRFCQDARTLEVMKLKIIPNQGIEGFIDEKFYKIYRISDHAQHQIALEGPSGSLATFILEDKLRLDILREIDFYKANDIHLKILSGDRHHAVDAVARSLQIEDAAGELGPVDKLDIVKSAQANRQVVCMVGDGLNDAPVLKQADLSFAMNSGVEMSQLSADAIVLTGEIKTIRHAIEAAKRTRQVMWQNLCWSMAYNVVMLPLAAMGFLTPYWAAIGMSLSSVLVVWNSLRLDKIITRL
ncbi:MAG: heavy metal translocating P-type ATPase [Gammaproteobacteria bacterium]